MLKTHEHNYHRIVFIFWAGPFPLFLILNPRRPNIYALFLKHNLIVYTNCSQKLDITALAIFSLWICGNSGTLPTNTSLCILIKFSHQLKSHKDYCLVTTHTFTKNTLVYEKMFNSHTHPTMSSLYFIGC